MFTFFWAAGPKLYFGDAMADNHNAKEKKFLVYKIRISLIRFDLGVPFLCKG